MTERREMTTKPLNQWFQHLKYQHCTSQSARKHIREWIGNGKAIVMANGEYIDFHPQDYIIADNMIMDEEGHWHDDVYLIIQMEETILF